MSRVDRKNAENVWQRTHNLYVTYESDRREREKQESRKRDDEHWKKFRENTRKFLDNFYERWGHTVGPCIVEATPDYIIFDFIPYPGSETYQVKVSLEDPHMSFGGNEWGGTNQPSWVFERAYTLKPARKVYRYYFRESESESIVAHDLYTSCLSVFDLPSPKLEYWK